MESRPNEPKPIGAKEIAEAIDHLRSRQGSVVDEYLKEVTTPDFIQAVNRLGVAVDYLEKGGNPEAIADSNLRDHALFVLELSKLD